MWADNLNFIAISSSLVIIIMGKKGKKAQAGKPKKVTPKDIGKKLDSEERKKHWGSEEDVLKC